MCFGTHLEYFGRPHILTRPINPLNQKFSYPLQTSRSRRGGVRGNERARDALTCSPVAARQYSRPPPIVIMRLARPQHSWIERLPSNKEGKNSKCFVELSVAYRFSLLKSRIQLYRSYIEFASICHTDQRFWP